MDKVSVIIAAYNIENYIERCLNSILNQTYGNLEIIVVNDGSEDNTLEIINKIYKKDNRIIIINKENEGVNSARKIGLKRATGKYVLFVDGDDWIELDTVQELYKNISLRNLDVLLYNAYEAYDIEKKEINTFSKELSEDYLKELLLTNIMPSICFKFIKRECIQDVEFPIDTVYGEDLVVICDLFTKSINIGTLDKHLYNYYQRDDSVSNVISSKILDLDKSMSLIEAILIRKKIYKIYTFEFEFLIYRHLFINYIINNNCRNDIVKQLYGIYKKKHINVKNNEYINSIVNEGNIAFKLRKIIYNRSYTLGNIYDSIRLNIKSRKEEK